MFSRLQNSPYFCVFKYVRAVKQKVWNDADNRERETLTPRFTDFFSHFEKKNRPFYSLHVLFCTYTYVSIILKKGRPTARKAGIQVLDSGFSTVDSGFQVLGS